MLTDQRVLVVGGSSGIGFAAASMALRQGAKVTIASRSKTKLDAAAAKLGGGAVAQVLDATQNDAIETFFDERSPFDHIVISAAQTKVASVKDLPLEDAIASMDSKFWGAYRIARAANLTVRGSLTFVSGFLAIRPKKGTAIQSAINAGLEGLTKALALEYAPIRVNAVSPGLVATEMYDRLGNDSRKAMFEGVVERLPAGVLGQPDHIAVQIIAFMANPYCTGSVVYVDGGGALV
jgi:NAD(P)-dependent dehydrogenase (short-subunit alcohol dehydrogenase family)